MMNQGIDAQIQDRILSSGGNPQALMQSYQQNQQLIDLLALQKLKSDQDAAKRAMLMNTPQNPQTVAAQLQGEMLGRSADSVAQNFGDTAQNAMQRMQAMQQAQAGQQGGIAPLAQNAGMQGFARGGAVRRFAEGGEAGPVRFDPNNPADLIRAKYVMQALYGEGSATLGSVARMTPEELSEAAEKAQRVLDSRTYPQIPALPSPGRAAFKALFGPEELPPAEEVDYTDPNAATDKKPKLEVSEDLLARLEQAASVAPAGLQGGSIPEGRPEYSLTSPRGVPRNIPMGGVVEDPFAETDKQFAGLNAEYAARPQGIASQARGDTADLVRSKLAESNLPPGLQEIEQYLAGSRGPRYDKYAQAADAYADELRDPASTRLESILAGVNNAVDYAKDMRGGASKWGGAVKAMSGYSGAQRAAQEQGLKGLGALGKDEVELEKEGRTTRTAALNDSREQQKVKALQDAKDAVERMGNAKSEAEAKAEVQKLLMNPEGLQVLQEIRNNLVNSMQKAESKAEVEQINQYIQYLDKAMASRVQAMSGAAPMSIVGVEE